MCAGGAQVSSPRQWSVSATTEAGHLLWNLEVYLHRSEKADNSGFTENWRWKGRQTHGANG
jgi:hypothetical protein